MLFGIIDCGLTPQLRTRAARRERSDSVVVPSVRELKLMRGRRPQMDRRRRQFLLYDGHWRRLDTVVEGEDCRG